MDESYVLELLWGVAKEMWLMIVAIAVLTQLVKDLQRWVPHRLVSVIIGFAYGIGAWATGYLSGTWYVVVLLKTPLAIMFAQAAHERIYKVLKTEVPVAVTNLLAATKNPSN